MPDLTTTDAARILGIGRSRVLFLIRTKRIAAVKVGMQWMIKPKALEADGVKDRKAGRAGWACNRTA
jgi:excisionase family DNA binding protein